MKPSKLQYLNFSRILNFVSVSENCVRHCENATPSLRAKRSNLIFEIASGQSPTNDDVAHNNALVNFNTFFK